MCDHARLETQTDMLCSFGTPVLTQELTAPSVDDEGGVKLCMLRTPSSSFLVFPLLS